MTMRRYWLAACLMAVFTVAACGGNQSQTTDQGAAAPSSTVQINGAGATFPNPIYSKWFSEYNKLHPNIQINYQPIGSGGGIRQLTSQTVFFGASDGPMTDEQLKGAPGAILHFPTVLGAVVPVFNLAGITDLKFNGPVLADIYLGKIKKWNAPAIATLNPGVKLPATDIVVAHRSEGSGTTYIWVDYLSKVSPEFKQKVGVNASVNWPVGVGGKGNDGVSGVVSQTPGAIGYVELIFALKNNISYGSVQNAAGEIVKATPESVTKAAAGVSDLVVHLVAPLRESFRQGDVQGDGGLHYLGDRRRPEVRNRARLCVAPRRRRDEGNGRTREDQGFLIPCGGSSDSGSG